MLSVIRRYREASSSQLSLHRSYSYLTWHLPTSLGVLRATHLFSWPHFLFLLHHPAFTCLNYRSCPIGVLTAWWLKHSFPGLSSPFKFDLPLDSLQSIDGTYCNSRGPSITENAAFELVTVKCTVGLGMGYPWWYLGWGRDWWVQGWTGPHSESLSQNKCKSDDSNKDMGMWLYW